MLDRLTYSVYNYFALVCMKLASFPRKDEIGTYSKSIILHNLSMEL